mgnify:CR=1 FL=1
MQIKGKINQIEKLKTNLNESENLLDSLKSTHEKSQNLLTSNLEGLVGNQIELLKYISPDY